MKLIAYLLLALSAISGAFAVEAQKSFIISFTDDTSDSVIEAAKKQIADAKGVITHEYTIIKAFAATAGEKVFESLQVWAKDSGAVVEEDQVVTIEKQHS
ncbi:putative endopeptidase inhibitor-like protein [Diaporthe ampelina]|uniref:Putative endopeptidase inhibitor-like protein n=1 Tax=Diaporthe ampelina TaxID=1214573 RepID=A0A0G2ICP0_9PEZI|nr:putative endopeptidase inhibitor-like protein [Diaporthe ampelina]